MKMKKAAEREEKDICTVFADLKATFDKVDGGRLRRIMKEKGLQEALIGR